MNLLKPKQCFRLSSWALLLSLLMSMATLPVQAQFLVPVKGQLTTDVSSYALDSIAVEVRADTGLGFTRDTFFTDSSGYFSDSLSVSQQGQGRLLASVTTCDNQLATDVQIVTVGSAPPDTFRLNACPAKRLIIKGNLSSADPDYDLRNQPVTITTSPSLGIYQASVQTVGQAGRFSDTTPALPAATRGWIAVSLSGCRGQLVTDTQFVRTDNIPNLATLSFSLEVCPPGGPLSISGTVTRGRPLASQAQVYLLDWDKPGLASQGTVVDSTLVNSRGEYTFSGVDTGSYLLRAALLPSSPGYKNYTPAYYAFDTMQPAPVIWRRADPVQLQFRDLENRDIRLPAVSNAQGPGFISGYVARGGANKKAGINQPLPDRQVTLLDSTGRPFAFQLTDEAGFYEFPNLPLGRYQLRVEVPGKPCEVTDVTLTRNNLSASDILYGVRDSAIVVEQRAVYTAAPQPLQARVYPNPVSHILHITLPRQPSASTELKLVSEKGRVVRRATVQPGQAGQQQWDLADQPDGLYLLQLQNRKGMVTQPVIKQE